MKPMHILLAILAILALLVFYGFWRLNRTTTQKNETTYGPFVIKSVATTGKAFNMNYGMVNQTTVRQTILYNGQPVLFPDALQTNTGLPFLWRVHALVGPAEPTLLAGSQSLYLVYIRDGKAVVERVNEQNSDFASIQCLDSENGQPGERREVYMYNNIEDTKKLDTIQCSQYLLVNNCIVLNVNTLKQTPFNTSNNTVGHYFLNHNPGALGFSPDRKVIVFRSSFSSYDTETQNLPDSEGGLVAYDYMRDTGYVIPYDDTELRVTNPDDLNEYWFETYFEWVKNKQGDGPLVKSIADAFNAELAAGKHQEHFGAIVSETKRFRGE